MGASMRLGAWKNVASSLSSSISSVYLFRGTRCYSVKKVFIKGRFNLPVSGSGKCTFYIAPAIQVKYSQERLYITRSSNLMEDKIWNLSKGVKTKDSENDSLVVNEEISQAPNRSEKWSFHQKTRSMAMSGARFEQMNIDDQPQPYAAIQLIHKQPVRWSHERVVSCDGGGGATGHPRIFINLDQPEISYCTYCGIPYANENHRAHLESLSSTTYPLEPVREN